MSIEALDWEPAPEQLRTSEVTLHALASPAGDDEPLQNQGNEEDFFDSGPLTPMAEMAHAYNNHPLVEKDYARRLKPMRGRLTGDELGDYLKQIGRFNLLDKNREVFLSTKLQTGLAAWAELKDNPDNHDRLEPLVIDGVCAYREFFESNLRLVVPIARRHVSEQTTLMEAITMGNMGLFRAIEKFDPARGYKFSTYATWWVRQACDRIQMCEERTIRLPVHQEQLMASYKRACSYYMELHIVPTDEELAHEMGTTAKNVRRLKQGLRIQPDSLDRPLRPDDPDGLLGNFVPDYGTADDMALVDSGQAVKSLLRNWRDVIDDKDMYILASHYGLLSPDSETQTTGDIGKELGITHQRVSQLESRALLKLARQSLMPKLYDRCNLDEEERQAFDNYFMAATELPKRGRPKKDETAETFYQAVTEQVTGILDLTFGRERIAAVIVRVIWTNQDKKLGKDNGLDRLQRRLCQRFGLWEYSPGERRLAVQRLLELRPVYHQMETEVLASLLALPRAA